MKLYSYVVRNDVGLAPNPFWGYCTLAVCTPNHMGTKVEKGDWIIGTSSVSRGNKLVYAMEVSETLTFDSYYGDSRFEKKKPSVYGSWREKCGDNMYYKDSQGEWVQHRTTFHHSAYNREQDVKHPVAFIAENFYYFGDKSVELPTKFQDLIWVRQGCKSNHNPKTVEGFLYWLKSSFSPGNLGEPQDNKDARESSCSICEKAG